MGHMAIKVLSCGLTLLLAGSLVPMAWAEESLPTLDTVGEGLPQGVVEGDEAAAEFAFGSSDSALDDSGSVCANEEEALMSPSASEAEVEVNVADGMSAEEASEVDAILSDGAVPGFMSDGASIQDAKAAASEWEPLGTCEWRINEDGCLVIRPAGGAAEGSLPNDGEFDSDDGRAFWPWESSWQLIQSVRIDGRIVAGDTADSMFSGLRKAKTIEGLSGLDTSRVTSMQNMFYSCWALESLDLSSFNTSLVTLMGSMFSGCESLSCLDLKSFDTSSAEDMSGMFTGCTSIETLDLSNFVTKRVYATVDMFSHCNSLTSLDISNFDTRNIAASHDLFGFKGLSIVPLEVIKVGPNFTLQDQLPGGEWYSQAGEAFSPDTLPHEAGVYATSMEWFEPLTVMLGESSKTVDLDAASFELTATVAPQKKEASLTWSSSDSSVATVDSDGRVTVLKAGEASICAQAEASLWSVEETAEASCELTVNPVVLGGYGGDDPEGIPSLNAEAVVEDAALASKLNSYRVRVMVNAGKNDSDYRDALLADVDASLGQKNALVDLVDVDLVDASGTPFDWESLGEKPTLDLRIEASDLWKELAGAGELKVWRVEEAYTAASAHQARGNAAEVDGAEIDGDTLRFKAAVPGTYAITTAAPSSPDDQPSTGPGDDVPSRPGDNEGSAGQQPSGPGSDVPGDSETDDGSENVGGGDASVGDTAPSGTEAKDSSDAHKQADDSSKTAKQSGEESSSQQLAQTGEGVSCQLAIVLMLCVASGIISVLSLHLARRRRIASFRWDDR